MIRHWRPAPCGAPGQIWALIGQDSGPLPRVEDAPTPRPVLIGWDGGPTGQLRDRAKSDSRNKPDVQK